MNYITQHQWCSRKHGVLPSRSPQIVSGLMLQTKGKVMRYIKEEKLTELEKILIESLLNSCQPNCSHEGCSRKRMLESLYRKGMDIAEKYRK